MRRLNMPEAADFLNDIDKHIVLEAARAIHDEPIAKAMPKLAQMTQRSAEKMCRRRAILRVLAAKAIGSSWQRRTCPSRW